MRKALTAVLVALTALPAWATAATDVPVRVDPNFQEDRPSVSSSHMAWDASRSERTDRVDVYVQPTGGQPTRINGKNTDAFMGALDGSRLAY